MSPEYTSWKKAPRSIRDGIQNNAPQRYDDYRKDGCIAKVVGEEVRATYFPNEVESWVLGEAAKQKSAYHRLIGYGEQMKARQVVNKSSIERRFIDKEFVMRGHSPCKYRGNHRSHVKGNGTILMIREGKFIGNGQRNRYKAKP